MSTVVQFKKPGRADEIIETLNSKDDTKELYVLRVSIDKDGTRHLEWYVTESDSKISAVGALHLLAHKILESEYYE